MKIVALEKVDREKVIQFLLPYEKFSVTLMSEILHGAESVYVVLNHFGNIKGVFSWWKGSSIHHCLPDAYGKNKVELENAFVEFFKDENMKYLFSLIGEEAGNELIKNVIEKNFSKTPTHKLEYFLLENNRYDSKVSVERMNTQLSISICKEEEIEEIFPLQLEYEKEEVLISGKEINENGCYAKLESYIEAGAIYLGKIKNKCLCKATITEKGKNYVMLGGVYTIPKYRNHGLAKALLYNICQEFNKRNKKIALFVKKENVPAKKLYEALGFKKVCNYEILYY